MRTPSLRSAHEFERGPRRAAIVEQRRLGDLEVETLRRELGRGKRIENRLFDPAVAELDRGQIDGDADVARPGGASQARSPQHAGAEFLHEAQFLDDRNELAGRHPPAHRMVPARQRLEAGDFAGDHGNDGLVVDLDRVVRHRRAQIELDETTDLNLGVHRPLEGAPVAPPVAFGGVERHVGVRKDRLRCQAVVRRARAADAGADDHFVAVDEDRPSDFADDLARRVPPSAADP